MDIQTVTAATREPAVRLLQRFFAEEDFTALNGRLTAHLDQMIADTSCWVAMATIGNEAVGIVTVTTMLYIEWGRLGEISDLYVLPQHRGRGIGTSLATAATDWCRAQRCSAMSVVVAPGGDMRHRLSHFYRHLRFEALGRTILYRKL